MLDDNNNKLTFSLDYDDTFTADPELWAYFINKARQRGHEVVCITARNNTPENYQELRGLFDFYKIEIDIHFSNLCSKMEYAYNNDLKVNIWLDDRPDIVAYGV